MDRRYDLANLSAGTDLRGLAATIKARRVCEQARQQLKEELGLHYFASCIAACKSGTGKKNRPGHPQFPRSARG
jgi:hypothetical protein